MNLYFVRHGQTNYNIEGRIQGGMDIPLNEKGIEQAKALAITCAKSPFEFDGIFSSPKVRAIQTAEIIARELNGKYQVLEGIQEINLGDWQGLTWDEVRERYPESYEVWYHERRYSKSSQGESYQDMLNRVVSALEQVLHIGYDNVLIVTHSAVIMCLCCLVNHVPFESMMQYKPDNGQIVKLDSNAIIVSR